MATDAQIAANVRNSQKSTGPRSDAGKARSSKNALKHGLTSKDITLPGEDPKAYREQVRQWVEYYSPDPAQLAVIERAVSSKLKLDRLTRAETARLSMNRRHALDEFDQAAFEEVAELGRRLINEPLNRCAVPQTADPYVREKLERRAADQPCVLSRKLQTTALGVTWLLEEWTILKRMLLEHGYWHYPEKIRAIRLLGRNPQDVMEDEEVQRFMLACNILHPEANGQHDDAFTFLDECIQVKLGIEDRPMYELQVRRIAELRPKNRREAVDVVWARMEQERARLLTLKAELTPVEVADRLEAEDRALFDASHEAVLMRRYETALEREFHRSIADLMRLRKEMPADEDTPPVEPEPEPAPAQEAPVRNEPNAEVEKKPEVPQNAPEPKAAPSLRFESWSAPASKTAAPGQNPAGPGGETAPERPR